MDLKHLISIKIGFFLLVVFSIDSFGQELCTVPLTADLLENNEVGAVVANLTSEEGVSLVIKLNPDDAFEIIENQLVAKKMLDYETLPEGGALQVGIECRKGVVSFNKLIIVIVTNVNDNPPVFAQSQYTLRLNELSPKGTSVGKIEATDLDKERLYYSLESPMGEFELQSDINPQILVSNVLYYDTTPEVSLKLLAQDTPLSATVTPSHTATATIKVSIIDINNRPPWFLPCNESFVETAKICTMSGYSGRVTLTEQETGSLPLEPGPVNAIDGDKGKNDIIYYKIHEGNENDIFGIDLNSGSITMNKPVNVAGPIVMQVMAYEKDTPDMFAMTTVTLQVANKSVHPPEFVKSSYEGIISEDAGVGSLVLESKSMNKPLQVQAKDADFFNEVNPNVIFEVTDSSNFKITTEGFILMTGEVPAGTVAFQIRAVDSTNGEFSTADLAVEITPGVLTTTDMPTTSTDIATSTPIATDITESTSNTATVTTDYDTSVSSYTDALPKRIGDYRTEDMIALGVSLAIVLILCFVVIGLLAYNIRRYNTNWRKLSEASIFRSNLSGKSGGPTDGVQYTNEGFQNDSHIVNSKEEADLPLSTGLKMSRKVPEVTESQSSVLVLQSNSNVHGTTSATDSSSLNASDSEKEVKPILTKERRMEDGYKAVWFKEDIDPNNKDEVVIHDSGEQDTDQGDDHDSEDVEDYEHDVEL